MVYKKSKLGKIGRNEPCHCGSGKKYKDCHLQANEQKEVYKTKWIISGLVVLVLLVIIIGMFANMEDAPSQPAGEAPAGKVWSPEHGHWHDAP